MSIDQATQKRLDEILSESKGHNEAVGEIIVQRVKSSMELEAQPGLDADELADRILELKLVASADIKEHMGKLLGLQDELTTIIEEVAKSQKPTRRSGFREWVTQTARGFKRRS